jgi:Tfp pilus assembly protein PilV
VNSIGMQRSHFGRRSRARGFAVVEALVAFLVVAFGMMALASFQFTLSRSSDAARQRSEAARIAQMEIDRLRSIGQREADGNTDDNRLTFEEEVAAGSPAATQVASALSNTTYNLSRTVSAPTGPAPTKGERYRWIEVAVQWTDRAGADQRVSLSTAISDGAPGDAGFSTSGRSGVPGTLRPKNRNINIPYPAVTLAGGQTSGFIPPPGNTLFVFNNETGRVVRRCTSASTITLTENMTTSALTCTTFAVEAHVLSGYIRFKTNGNNQGVTRLDVADPLGFTDATRALVATDLTQAPSATTSPVLITSTATGYAPSAYECYAQRQLTVKLQGNAAAGQTDIRNIPDLGTATVVPAGFTDQNAPRHIAYICIVTPVDHDSNPNTPGIWSGLVTFNPRGGWAFDIAGNGNRRLGQPTNNLGEATGKARLCRFTSDYNYDSSPTRIGISNGEHPRYYRQVTGTLDNQNYLVVDGEDDCPGDVAITPTAANPTADNYNDTNTVLHQPGPLPSSRCATINGNNTVGCTTADANWSEALLPTTIPLSQIPME